MLRFKADLDISRSRTSRASLTSHEPRLDGTGLRPDQGHVENAPPAVQVSSAPARRASARPGRAQTAKPRGASETASRPKSESRIGPAADCCCQTFLSTQVAEFAKTLSYFREASSSLMTLAGPSVSSTASWNTTRLPATMCGSQQSKSRRTAW